MKWKGGGGWAQQRKGFMATPVSSTPTVVRQSCTACLDLNNGKNVLEKKLEREKHRFAFPNADI